MQLPGHEFAEVINRTTALTESLALASYMFDTITVCLATEGGFHNQLSVWAYEDSKNPRALIVLKGANVVLSEKIHRYLSHLNDPGTSDDRNLVCDLYVAHIGKSSFVTKSELRFIDSNDSDILASYEDLYVMIDSVSRRPKELPMHLVEPVIEEIKKQNYSRFELVTVDKVPCTEVRTMEYSIKKADIDVNNHTTLTTYLSLASSCSSKVLGQGQSAHTKSLKVAFFGESVMGDILKVICWSDQYGSDVISCVIEKKGHVIFKCQMEYFSTAYDAKL